MIKAALMLSKPAEQNPVGKEAFAAYSAFEDHTWPPWLHSQIILSFLSCGEDKYVSATRSGYGLGDEPPLQLHDHQSSANCGDDKEKRPEEPANADPDV